jgi:hypothetical protein
MKTQLSNVAYVNKQDASRMHVHIILPLLIPMAMRETLKDGK